VLISKSYRYRQRQHEQRLLVKDAQPVAFERSAASGYLKTIQSSVSIGKDPDLVQLGL